MHTNILSKWQPAKEWQLEDYERCSQPQTAEELAAREARIQRYERRAAARLPLFDEE